MAIQPGDRVAMSVQWLKSCRAEAGPIGHYRGTVQEIVKGMIAVVQWDGAPDFPSRLNVNNLARVGLNDKFSAC